MPLLAWKKNIGKNITELKADNKKFGKEKGAEGKVRPMKQIVAIALNVAKVPKKIENMKMDKKMEGMKKHEKMETPKFKKVEVKKGKKS